jgi:hypothetical protein
MMSKNEPIRLRIQEGEKGAAYLELLAYPTDGRPPTIVRTVDIHNMIPNYFGPRLALDLDKDGRAVGMEILYSSQDIDEGRE